MTLLTFRNIRMAVRSIKSTKTRSLLTMVGIIIGVASVITAVSLGEGVRRQVAGNLQTSGEDVISLRSGRLVNRDKDGKINSVNYGAIVGTDTLTDQDLQTLNKTPSVSTVVPLSTISALMTNREGRQFDGPVIGTGTDFEKVSAQKIAFGSFFNKSQETRDVAVIGKSVAEQLFQENVPIGQVVVLRGHEFSVIGVFDSFTANSLSNGGDLNRAVFIPYQAARSVSGNTASIYQILIKPKVTVEATIKDVQEAIKTNHGGQEDFAVLTQDETLQLAGKTLTSLTAFIAGIAAISLIVGGIGIMNIMFVSVTERTREIGVRKSLGATNRQIHNQFLTEAAIISVVGGIIGVLISLVADFCFRIFTSLTPAITWPIIGIAVLASTAVGIIFGTAPAIKAARKDPIESLRYE